MNANPLDSCVSGLRMTLMESATRFSAESQDLMSSAVTQAGRLPRKTVLLIRRCVPLRCGGIFEGISSGMHSHANTRPGVCKHNTAGIARKKPFPGRERLFFGVVAAIMPEIQLDG